MTIANSRNFVPANSRVKTLNQLSYEADRRRPKFSKGEGNLTDKRKLTLTAHQLHILEILIVQSPANSYQLAKMLNLKTRQVQVQLDTLMNKLGVYDFRTLTAAAERFLQEKAENSS